MSEIIYQLIHCSDLVCHFHIQWLSENDVTKLNEHLIRANQNPMDNEVFKNIYKNDGIRYCLLYYNGVPVARGAVEPYSEYLWEAADIKTIKEYRGKGFAKEILKFLSIYILKHGKIATCRTEEDNVVMQKVIKYVGYKEVNKEIVSNYPFSIK